jgi:hypothetical protein
VKLPRPGTRQPSSRRHHHSPEAYPRVWSLHPPWPFIDTISTPSLTINVEPIPQPICTHVRHTDSKHDRLHDARLSSARYPCCCLIRRGPQELTWHWERGSRWERKRGAHSLTCDPPSLHLWRLLNNNLQVYLTGMPMLCVAQSIPCLLGTLAEIADAHAPRSPRYALCTMLDACPCRQ